MLTRPQVTQGKDLLFQSGYKTFVVRGSIIIGPGSSQARRQPGRTKRKRAVTVATPLRETWCLPAELPGPNSDKFGPLEHFCGVGDIHERVLFCIRAVHGVSLGHLLLAITGYTAAGYMHLPVEPAEPCSYMRVPYLLLHAGILEPGLPQRTRGPNPQLSCFFPVTGVSGPASPGWIVSPATRTS